MNFLSMLFDSLLGFVRRNPLLTMTILMLAVFAPWVLKGVAMFILYFVIAILLLGLVLLSLLRWRIAKMQRQMNDRFGGGGASTSGGYSHTGYPGGGSTEGEVKVYRTSETPEKRIADDVGDYVEFEETKNEK